MICHSTFTSFCTRVGDMRVAFDSLCLNNLTENDLFIQGILMGAWPCKKIVMLGELYGSESISQVYGQIHILLQENAEHLKTLSNITIICLLHLCHCFQLHIQQNACAMMMGATWTSLHAMTLKRKDITNTSCPHQTLKLHFRGHVDKINGAKETVTPMILMIWNWYVICPTRCTITCAKIYVDTEICEQVFCWMSRYGRIMQHMNRHHFLFYLIYLSDSRNRIVVLSTYVDDHGILWGWMKPTKCL